MLSLALGREGTHCCPCQVCRPSQGPWKAWDGLPASWLTLCTWKPERRAGAGVIFLLMLRERWVSELFRLRLQQSQTMKACFPGGQKVGSVGWCRAQWQSTEGEMDSLLTPSWTLSPRGQTPPPHVDHTNWVQVESIDTMCLKLLRAASLLQPPPASVS